MHGLLHILRNGFDDRCIKIKIASFKPKTTLNQEVIDRYNANILTYTRKFKYSTKNENSISIISKWNSNSST